jgi:hypothetical protein
VKDAASVFMLPSEAISAVLNRAMSICTIREQVGL